jgi:tight adherence protein C
MDTLTLVTVASVAVTAGLVVLLFAALLPARSRVVDDRLAEIEAMGGDLHTKASRRRRFYQAEWIRGGLLSLGSRLSPGSRRATNEAAMLTQAGYRREGALAVFWAVRLMLATGLGVLPLLVMPPFGAAPKLVVLTALYLAATGFLVPLLIVKRKQRIRKKEIEHALADALDLLVVCVEAGLGLNQALVRVAAEIGHISPVLSAELLQTNAEIRAGTPRDMALRQLADRTGVEDLSALATMLIQTDRFGTSISRSLRVHSDVLRQKRRQRAEERAAKTTIKMVFPLAFCVFPAIFVVILGPGIMNILRSLGGLE